MLKKHGRYLNPGPLDLNSTALPLSYLLSLLPYKLFPKIKSQILHGVAFDTLFCVYQITIDNGQTPPKKSLALCYHP